MCNDCCKSLGVVKTAKLLKGKQLTLHVGTGAKKQTFTFHKALLDKVTKHFVNIKVDTTDVELPKEDPEIIDMIHRWLYRDYIEEAPHQIPVKKENMPSKAEIQRLEADLRVRFNAHEMKLVGLYCLAEKWGMEDLMNRAIDKIQDGFHNYGTVFGPGFVTRIFQNTKKGSQLRELCIAANVLHMDRGCDQLRKEIMTSAMLIPDYFPAMLKWISRNFALMGVRADQGFNVRTRTGFSVLNHKSVCPCHFHTHKNPDRAHKDHIKHVVKHQTCCHGNEEDEDMPPELAELAAMLGMGLHMHK